MYLLNLSNYSVDDFFDEMLEGRHDNAKNKYLKTRLISVKSKLINAEKDYKILANDGVLYRFSEQDSITIPPDAELDEEIPKTITASEMEKVYSNFFVDKPDSLKISRSVYEEIMSNTYYNLCPYCSHREVKTIDHFLPKSKFIPLTIVPANLLPCCSDCNKDKLDDIHLTDDKMLIHPYFDNINTLDWLTCTVIKGTWPITFSYNVSKNIIDPKIKSRICYQFKLLNLDKLYADNASREFNNRVKSLVREFNSNPENKAFDFIDDNLESYQSENKNSWQTKMFEALKKSSWFIKEALPNLQKFYQK